MDGISNKLVTLASNLYTWLISLVNEMNVRATELHKIYHSSKREQKVKQCDADLLLLNKRHKRRSKMKMCLFIHISFRQTDIHPAARPKFGSMVRVGKGERGTRGERG